MASEGGPATSGDYITHHLQNLQACKNDAGEWVFGACPGEFWAINVDSMFWAVLLGLVFCFTFRMVFFFLHSIGAFHFISDQDEQEGKKKT